MFLLSLVHLFIQKTVFENLLCWALGVQTPIRHIKSPTLIKRGLSIFGQEKNSRLVFHKVESHRIQNHVCV